MNRVWEQDRVAMIASSKTAAIRMPTLSKLWGKQRVRLRPSQEVTRQIEQRLPEQQPTTQIMRRPGQAQQAPTRQMGQNEIPTRPMQDAEIPTQLQRPGQMQPPTRQMGQDEIPTRPMGQSEIPTQRMQRPRRVQQPGDLTTQVVRRGGPAEEETRLMQRPELAGDDFVLPPRQEELDLFGRGIPRGMMRTKLAIRLPGLGRLKGIGGVTPKAKNYFSDMMGGKLRQRGQELLNRPGGRASATAAGAKALRSGRLRQVATPAAGLGAAGAGAGALAIGREEAGGGISSAQQRLRQRLDSPVGGLLEDIINPETEEMAAARAAKREELGDDVSLLQRWQLMDPSMRTLLVSLLLGGGLGLAGSMSR